jgi:hypothetical protein
LLRNGTGYEAYRGVLQNELEKAKAALKGNTSKPAVQ